MSISQTNAWSMWFIVSIFYAYQYVLRVMPNILMDDIMKQYTIDAAVFGQFSGVYYLGYSGMQIPLAIMLDSYGPKKVIPACIFLTSIGLLPLLFTNIWIYPIIGRVLIGIGSSAAILGAFKIIRLGFPPNKFTQMLSFCVTIGLVGAIYGGGPVNYLHTIFGYQAVVSMVALTGSLLALLAYFLIPYIPQSHTSSMTTHIKEVFLSPKIMIVCVLSGLFVGPLEGFADVWARSFLNHVYHFSENISATLPSAIFLGMAFGGPLLSFIAEKTHNYLGTIIAAGLIMMTGFILLVSETIPAHSMSILFVLIGISCAYKILAIHQASSYVRENLVGISSAVANMITMFFGYFFHTILGLLITYAGGPTSSYALRYGVSIIPLALALGCIGFLAIALHDYFTQKGSL